HPSSCKILRMYGLGVALTAKYSLKPLFQANASFTRRAFSRIPFSSYRWKGVGTSDMIACAWASVTNGSFCGLTRVPFLLFAVYGIPLYYRRIFPRVQAASVFLLPSARNFL